VECEIVALDLLGLDRRYTFDFVPIRVVDAERRPSGPDAGSARSSRARSAGSRAKELVRKLGPANRTPYRPDALIGQILSRLRVLELVAIELQRARILCNCSLNILGEARLTVSVYFEPDRNLRLAGFPQLTHDGLSDIANVTE